jgi:hypothetical protein
MCDISAAADVVPVTIPNFLLEKLMDEFSTLSSLALAKAPSPLM